MKNLCIIPAYHRFDNRDIREIVTRVQSMDGSILVTVRSPFQQSASVEEGRWKLPSLTVAFGESGFFVPRRGPLYECKPCPKLEQYARFVDAGLNTPRTARHVPETHYDPGLWSEFVILKPLPLTLTSRSGSCVLMRSSQLSVRGTLAFPAGHALRDAPALVQEFIDTGLYPQKWRVLSFLGEPLYSSITRSLVPRASLDSSDEVIESSIVDAKNKPSKYLDSEGRRNELKTDPEVLAFARRIHAVFPRNTLLGIDILRRESDGRLFVLEVNAGGNVWHFSSRKEGHRQRLGGKNAMIAQLGAWDVAAKALIRCTHENAR
jgi:hypothetical protein